MNNKLYEWVRNITQSQIDGFRRQMFNKENNILGIYGTSKF